MGGWMAARVSGRFEGRSEVGGIVIKHWIVASGMTLMMAAAAVAAPQELLSFGKGRPVPTGDAVRGGYVVNGVCWACHGSDLNGGSAPPLTGAAFYKEWQGRPAEELAAFIRNRMPKDDPGALSEAGARNVVAYIMTFANRRESLTGKQNGK